MKNKLKNILKRSDLVICMTDPIRAFYYRYLVSDEKLISHQFKKRIGRELDLENPKKFNDKLQWLKLNWYDPIATKCADKYEVRDIVIERIGPEYLNELIAVYNSVDEIDLDILPDKFVLKGTHGSGFNIICKDKKEMDWKKEFRKMRRWLRIDYHLQKRELVYKNIKPRIICEKYIDTEDDKPLRDYKIFCFNGEPKAIFLCKNRGINTTFDFYDLDWNYLDIKNHYPNSAVIEDKPKKLDKMLELAKKLSKGFPHARVDFYYEKDSIIFGEITFFHFSGMEKFEPESFDVQMGNWLKLPQKQDVEVKLK